MAMIPVQTGRKDRLSFAQTDDTFACCVRLNMQLMVELSSPLEWELVAPRQSRDASIHQTIHTADLFPSLLHPVSLKTCFCQSALTFY